MSREFKGGDRVRIVDLGIYFPFELQGLFTGNLATVHADQPDYGIVYVATDGFQASSDTGGLNVWSFKPEQLEHLGVEDAQES